MGGNLLDQRMIPWKALNEGAKEPSYGSEEAAGADLHANFFDPMDDQAMAYVKQLRPGERMLVKTGVALELPPGTYAKIEGRSGLALKHGILILGGVVDSDYRGDIGVIMVNLGMSSFAIKHGDRIAQLIVKPYVRAIFEPSECLEGTERGLSGFGSTGA